MAIFSNQATLSYNGTEVTSNVVTGELLTVVNVSKTPVNDSYSPDGNVTYVVTLTNTGTAPVGGITLTDDLGASPSNVQTRAPLTFVDGSVKYFQNGVLQPAPAVTAGAPLVITGITVPAGGNATIVYQGDVNGFAPLDADGNIVNTITASGSGIPSPISATATVKAETGPALTINKSINPTVISADTPVTYTFVIENTGNTEAGPEAEISVSDTFNPLLSNLTVALNGNVLPQSDYSYDPSTGVFSTTPGVITVPAATFAADTTTGRTVTNPGSATLTVTGTTA